MIKNPLKKPVFNDGLVRVYKVSDVAEPGRMPKEELTLKATLRYEEKRLGIYRSYTARQAQVEIARVIRCPRSDISTQDIAITEDGKQYRIDMVQAAPEIMPPVMDLTLVKIVQDYEVRP